MSGLVCFIHSEEHNDGLGFPGAFAQRRTPVDYATENEEQ